MLLDTESYDQMKKALGLLKLLAQGEDDIIQGRVSTQEDFFEAMDRLDTRNHE